MTALVTALTLSLGCITVSAATVPTDTTTKAAEKKDCGHEHRGGGALYSVLKNDLGFTDAQIEKAKSSGKNAFDLAKEKNISSDKLKALIIAQKTKKIDEEVASGRLTKEKGEEIKSKMQSRIEKWDGSLKPKEA